MFTHAAASTHPSSNELLAWLAIAHFSICPSINYVLPSRRRRLPLQAIRGDHIVSTRFPEDSTYPRKVNATPSSLATMGSAASPFHDTTDGVAESSQGTRR